MKYLKFELKVLQIVNMIVVMFLSFSFFFYRILEIEFKNFIAILGCVVGIIVYFIASNEKMKSIYRKASIVCLYALVILALFLAQDAVVVYAIYMLVVFYYVVVNVKSHESRDEVLENIKYISVFSMVMFILYLPGGEEYFSEVLNFYILLVPLNIIRLRIGRVVSSNIEDKNMRKTNLALIALIIISVSEIGQNLVKWIIQIVWRGFTFLSEIILKILIVVLYYPFRWIEMLREYLSNLESSKSQEQIQAEIDYASQEYETLILDETMIFNENVVAIVRVLLIIIFLFIIFYVIKKKFFYSKENIDEEVVEIIEKIEKRNSLREIFKDMFNRDNSLKGKVLFMYKKFMVSCKNKDLFRSSDTPTELGNRVEKHIKCSEELKNIREVYTKAKYSSYDIEELDVKTMERSLELLNERIK